MNKLITILFIITSVSSYSQINQSKSTSGITDCNGIAMQNFPMRQQSLHHQTLVQSATQYDTIRALTEINDNANADAYPWISPDGLRMYFTRGNASSLTNQLMFTSRANTSTYFSTSVAVPTGLSSLTSTWFSNDELNIYICKDDTLFFADRSTIASQFNPPAEIILTGSPSYIYVNGPSLNAAQDTLLVSILTGTWELAEFVRTSSNSFSYVRSMVSPVDYRGQIGQLSKDELSYFFSSSYNFGNLLLYQVSRATTADTFDLSTQQPMQDLNDTNIGNLQPSMTDNLEWIVFVRNSNNMWEGNDLYIAHQDVSTSVVNQKANNISVSLFPNPTNGKLTISLPTDDAEISITDILGKQIIKTTATQKSLNLELDNNGVYLVYVKTKQGMSVRKLIVNR